MKKANLLLRSHNCPQGAIPGEQVRLLRLEYSRHNASFYLHEAPLSNLSRPVRSFPISKIARMESCPILPFLRMLCWAKTLMEAPTCILVPVAQAQSQRLLRTSELRHLGCSVCCRHPTFRNWTYELGRAGALGCHRNQIELDLALNYRVHTEMELNICLLLLFSFLFKRNLPSKWQQHL